MGGVLVTPTAEQIADPEMRQLVAKELAKLFYAKMCEELGVNAGSCFPIPIALAARISGWNDRWIRRNLSSCIIVAEGQDDSINYGDLMSALENRKGGKA